MVLLKITKFEEKQIFMEAKVTIKVFDNISKKLRGTPIKGSMGGFVDEVIFAPHIINSWYREEIRIRHIVEEKKSILSRYMSKNDIESFYMSSCINAFGQCYLSNSDYVILKLNHLINEHEYNYNVKEKQITMDYKELESKFTPEFLEEFQHDSEFNALFKNMQMGMTPFEAIEHLCNSKKELFEHYKKMVHNTPIPLIVKSEFKDEK